MVPRKRKCRDSAESFLMKANSRSRSLASSGRQQMAYVAFFIDVGHLIKVGVARYASAEGDTQCDPAVVVAD